MDRKEKVPLTGSLKNSKDECFGLVDLIKTSGVLHWWKSQKTQAAVNTDDKMIRKVEGGREKATGFKTKATKKKKNSKNGSEI